jgi:CheY-like chemotaxis protein
MKLLVFGTRTMGDCELAICEDADMLIAISDMMDQGAHSVREVTTAKEARELVAHLDKFDLIIDDDVREYVRKMEVQP